MPARLIAAGEGAAGASRKGKGKGKGKTGETELILLGESPENCDVAAARTLSGETLSSGNVWNMTVQ